VIIKRINLTGQNLLLSGGSPGLCAFGIQFMAIEPTLGEIWLLGDTSGAEYCQIHNYEDKTIGFAESKNPKY